MRLPNEDNVIIKCKKCGNAIDDPSAAKLDKKQFDISGITTTVPSMPLMLMWLREEKKQKKYNKRYKTKNMYYRFGICKECLKKRSLIKAMLDVAIPL